MLLFTLPGTLTMYYGEEIGMVDLTIPVDEIKDPAERNQPGLGLGRDPERTPMLWDSSPMAGFTEGWPWLPIDSESKSRNVDVQKQDQGSIYNLYRKLIELRRKHPVLIRGKIGDVRADNNVLRFERSDDEERLLVLLNMGNDPVAVEELLGSILLSTNHELAGTRFKSSLDGSEGSIVALDHG
jgi:alpha-glucosidase